MKDEHFNNAASFLEAMIGATKEVHVDCEAFEYILHEMFDPMIKWLDDYCFSIDREVGGEMKEFNLFHGGVEDPASAILPGEGGRIERRLRTVTRLRESVSAQLKLREESADKRMRDMLVGEMIAALSGEKTELVAEPQMENRVEISERFLKIYDEYADVPFGDFSDSRLVLLAISYDLCSEERDYLKHEVEAVQSELEGSDAERYTVLLSLLDELRSKARNYLEKNPDFRMFDTDVFEFSEES